LSVLLVACYFDVSHYPHLSNLVPPAIKSSHFQLVGMKRTVLPARRMRDLVKRFSCPLGDERAKRLAIDLWLFQPGLPSCFSFFLPLAWEELIKILKTINVNFCLAANSKEAACGQHKVAFHRGKICSVGWLLGGPSVWRISVGCLTRLTLHPAPSPNDSYLSCYLSSPYLEKEKKMRGKLD